MSNKEIQMQRMWQYFVDATVEIIEQKGIENVTIREIATKAGYNSATIYNYFQEVSHLIFFAALKYLNKYIEGLPEYMEKEENPLDKYLLSWESFCKHSFEDPEIYYAIFLADLGENPEELLKYYYNVYQSDLYGEVSEDIKTIITDYNLSSRSRNELYKSVQEGMLSEETAAIINERTVLVWQGMLITVLNNRRHLNADEAAEKTMEHIKGIVNIYTLAK
ncbi:TetR family transcriptional regulator [Oceanobacillus oncorhynchi subsp. incaldanensis]|uniref:HTH-type transcriptional regulator BetI n=1 Tax=Oceanobacillus oncorhynchi TaxID=545501 RepID=A0A0A1MCI0_9BACI|nr:TetR/AcrR family transcriptional regulator [Oceanobacillus oncorhynchi]GIO17689.1 TetR family transcriptional regulator [Oceanobacillus oncorhynchi subsp. incaldanensis]CEI83070.1 HTH-type transcriptional regulator BetI [Oceanobacillus oncorhynchi]